jgi:peptide/nickel transport system permease protein
MVLILLTVTFLIIRALPGNPVALVVGSAASPQIAQQVTNELGLNKPIYIQYGIYLWGLLHGNLGNSIQNGEPVATQIDQRLPVSLELMFFGMIIGTTLGIVIGAFSASRPNSKMDISFRLYLILIGTFFTPFLALLFQYIFGVYLRVLPTSGIGIAPAHTYTGFPLLDALLNGQSVAFVSQLNHLILPALTLGIPVSGIIGRLTRSFMIDSYSQDYVLSARQRGIREVVVMRDYSLRNALLPMTTTIGLIAAGLIGGSVLIEQAFNWPGMGTYLTTAILSRNYPQVQGAIVVYALLIGLIGIAIDLSYSFLDPRVKV